MASQDRAYEPAPQAIKQINRHQPLLYKQLLRRWIVGSLTLGMFAGSMMVTVPMPSAHAEENSCATPGKDGPVNASPIVNTYFPPLDNSQLTAGETSIELESYYTEGEIVPISAGDMLMVIQMQDATIDSSNTAAYGSGNTTNGGRGQSSLGNSGVYEFVRATNSVPLTGGTLTFEGGGTSGGIVNNYIKADPTTTRGRRTFQVIRVVQYASLTLNSDVTVPDWNGEVGGVLALDIAGDMDFNGFTIDADSRGFRGGFVPNDPLRRSGSNNGNYVLPSSTTEGSGKGEGIAGTPHYMWDGVTEIDLGSDQLPGGDAGRGAPGNAGGGGNAHNAGGGGGGNGGDGGTGGIGWEGGNGDLDGSRGLGGTVPVAAPVGDRLIMGGGGGGGDVNDDDNGIRGGQGGGIVYIQADQFIGAGTITSNGSDGEIGDVVTNPDGAGGGGAGGTVALLAQAGNLSGLSVFARGGKGGNTRGDDGNEHGPGGGGGGGVVVSTSPEGQVPTPDVTGGDGGRANNGAGIPHGAENGSNGIEGTLNPLAIPPIQPGANCFPSLTVTKTEANPGSAGQRTAPGTANYSITVTNTGPGGASGVQITDTLPSGFTYESGATASVSGGATGPATPTNSGSDSIPVFGAYTIPKDGSVTINFLVNVTSGTAIGTYQNPAFATYLDPTRTNTQPNRLITASTTPLPGGNTTYESGSKAGNSTPGSNYDSASSTDEDVVIFETTQDYGDAPDTYGTDATASNSTSGIDPIGANHTVVSGIHLGATAPDTEVDAVAPLDGTGDGTDEDGIQLNGVSLQGQNITRDGTTTLSITTTGSGVLNAWIDWNGDGDFDEAGEQVATNDALASGTLDVAVPARATRGTSYARFRYSSDLGLGPTGTASDGEVEDYQIVISDQFIDDTPSATSCPAQGGTLVGANLYLPLDGGTMGFEDGSPDQSPTTDPYPGAVTGGIFTQYGSGTPPLLNPSYGQYSYVANIQNPRNSFQHDYTIDPVYGVTGRFFASDPDTDTPTMSLNLSGLTPNQFYEYSFWAANSEPNGDGNSIDIFIDGTSVFSTGPLPKVSAGVLWTKYTFTFTNGPKTSVVLALASTETGRDGNDFYLDNIEVRECQFAIDYGDAPSTYGDALHTTIPTTPSVYLGATPPDSETATLLGADAGAGADGDDTTDSDDEDAFTTLPDVPTTGTYDLTNIPVTNASGENATLHAWIDFDRDGLFSTSEYQSAPVANGATTAALSWPIPSGFTSAGLYARFRITQNDLIDDNATTADVDERSQNAVINGEVEDFFIPSVNIPNLLLTKRITAINRGLADEQLFDTSYVDSGSTNDNAVNWPGDPIDATIGAGTVESYITGILEGSSADTTVKPGDEVEFTISFLSNGNGVARNVLICDRIPTHTTFVPDAYNGVSSPSGGGNQGIFLNFNGLQVGLTNANDGDEIPVVGSANGIGGYFFAAGVEPNTVLAGINCGAANENGAIVVNLSDVPNATGEGTPTNAYGFIRFRTVVD